MRAEGSAVAGSDYSLFCDVTIPLPITVSATVITWTYQSGETRRVGHSAQLVFSPLTSDDEGVYICTAHYLVSGITSPPGSDSHEVSVSKSLHTKFYNQMICGFCILKCVFCMHRS